MNIQGKILSIVEGKLKVYEDLVLPGKVVEVVPNGTYFVLKGKEKTRYWFPRLVFETWYIGSNSSDIYKTKNKTKQKKPWLFQEMGKQCQMNH